MPVPLSPQPTQPHHKSHAMAPLLSLHCAPMARLEDLTGASASVFTIILQHGAMFPSADQAIGADYAKDPHESLPY